MDHDLLSTATIAKYYELCRKAIGMFGITA